MEIDFLFRSLPSKVVINCSVLPALQMKLNSPHESLKKEACWALSNITAGNRVQIQVGVANTTVCGCGYDTWWM